VFHVILRNLWVLSPRFHPVEQITHQDWHPCGLCWFKPLTGTNTPKSIHSSPSLPYRAKTWFIWARAWVSLGFKVWDWEALSAHPSPSSYEHLKHLWASVHVFLLLKLASRRLGVARWVPSLCGAPDIFCISPLLCGEFLVSTNLPLWGLGEAWCSW
jgi:hypothetical protein